MTKTSNRNWNATATQQTILSPLGQIQTKPPCDMSDDMNASKAIGRDTRTREMSCNTCCSINSGWPPIIESFHRNVGGSEGDWLAQAILSRKISPEDLTASRPSGG